MKYPDSPIRFTKAQFAMFGFGEDSTRKWYLLSHAIADDGMELRLASN
ncbi:MAG TPA: hypothetical protein VKD23_11455 [Terriglobales bacterium]|nr:hypothetical protein [Terriglobales bacterium]